ncbi:cytochrome c oxidase accessory protein CcoG [Azospirillum lipoferum]|uniref:4Fe-4S ferredoxin, iron-sulfur binding domain (FixG-like) n=1 Tax=Azospirillum lipoferum (strain 4B) TaxID=862719 RepID=G7ZCU3_AZOL4|nr:cytochrome c oxidase accessory protein CcoG [Azospirillum lipoferum]CBS89649.1 4Fe-4S ferredoxin, iron-sulfur binding domain (FixG-like) [Azospirillum lipoferum 4B]
MPSDAPILTRRPNRSPAAKEPQSDYASHRKIHPKSVRGRYRQMKTGLGAVLLALFALLPFLRWDRGPGVPDQAVLFDLGSQRFYIFAVQLWPQHVYYITGVMIIAAIGLFLATALGGRVWCGFTCPQTVWTDLFVWVERRVEGDRTDRIRLDKAPWTARWLAKKAVKHAAWLAISAVTGFLSIAYLTDAPTLAVDLLRFDAPALAAGSVLFMAGCTYLMAGFMREQMCFYVCPWPRIQAAMLDEDSLVVTYQDWRGEGRAPLRKSEGWDTRTHKGFGDCIDCGQCVQVCPTGIDIRDGIQMECIGCGLCVDACNDVMARIGRPGDLIRFDTLTAQAAKATAVPPPRFRLLRPRTIVYGLMLVVVGGAMTIALALKPSNDIAVLRDRAPLFVVLSDGRIQNAYTIKIANMSLVDRQYRLTLSGLPQASLALSGESGEAGELPLSARGNAVETYRIQVRVPQSALAGASTPLAFTLTPDPAGEPVRHDSVFLAP